jgi:hypothetical protein
MRLFDLFIRRKKKPARRKRIKGPAIAVRQLRRKLIFILMTNAKGF